MIKEILSQLLPLIEKLAPSIAKALGLNSIANATPWALYLLAKTFGLKLNELQHLPEAIANDPESSDKLQYLEDSFSEWFVNNSTEMTKRLSDLEIHVKVSFDNKVA